MQIGAICRVAVSNFLLVLLYIGVCVCVLVFFCTNHSYDGLIISILLKAIHTYLSMAYVYTPFHLLSFKFYISFQPTSSFFT